MGTDNTQQNNTAPQDILSILAQWATNAGQGSSGPQTGSANAVQALGNLATNNGQGSLNSEPNQQQWLGTSTPVGVPQGQQLQSQQVLQQTAQKVYQQKTSDALQQVPHQILGKMLDSWSANGGTQVPMSTPSTAPTTAQVAQSVNPNQQGAISALGNLPGVSNNSQPNSQTNVQSNSKSNTPTTNNSSWVGNPGDPIQERAMQIAQQKPGLLGSIFKGVFYNDQKMQLNNLKEAQEIAQGGPPLSQPQKAEATANYNSALLKQHQDFQSDLSDQIKSNVDAQTAYIKNTPLPTKASDWPAYTKKLDEYSQNTSDLSSRMIEGFNKYRNLKLQNPATNAKGNAQPNFAVGDTVSYNGKDRIIKSINEKTGRAILSD